MRYYRLTEDRKTVPCSIDEMNMDIDTRRVRETFIGKVRISTVFLGIDHNWDGGAPLLFETMVFGGELDESQERCSTWEEAVAMHRDMCARVRRTLFRVA